MLLHLENQHYNRQVHGSLTHIQLCINQRTLNVLNVTISYPQLHVNYCGNGKSLNIVPKHDTLFYIIFIILFMLTMSMKVKRSSSCLVRQCISQDLWTKHRLVCTHFDVFSMLFPNIRLTFPNSEKILTFLKIFFKKMLIAHDCHIGKELTPSTLSTICAQHPAHVIRLHYLQ